jgi:AcrR family transcriptional regulator
MEITMSTTDCENVPTKQKILNGALSLFSAKGFSETSIRDIAAEVGITTGTIYGHFASKDEILTSMLNDYIEFSKNMFHSQDLMEVLKKNPTGQGVSDCIVECTSVLTENSYYLSLFHLVHQEQHRNESFGRYLLVRFEDTKDYIARIIDVLKELNVISAQVNAEYWGVTIFSLLYTLSNLMAITNSQNLPGYSYSDIADILTYVFDVMINTYDT